MSNKKLIIELGKEYTNKKTGQKVIVTSLNFNGMEDVIGYKLLQSFRFNSKKHSNTLTEIFREVFI